MIEENRRKLISIYPEMFTWTWKNDIKNIIMLLELLN